MKAIRFGTKSGGGAFAAVFVVIVAACGGGTSATPEPTPSPTLSTTPGPTPTPTPLTNRPPTADFTFVPEAVPRGDNNQTIVTLTATASDLDGDLLTFEWEISRGTPATAEGEVVMTTFPGEHSYPVTLTVSDGRGGTVTVTKIVPLGGG